MKFYVFLLTNIVLLNNIYGQKIAFQRFFDSYSFLNSSIKDNLTKSGLNIEDIYIKDFNIELDYDYKKDQIYTVPQINRKIKENLNYFKELGYSFILIPLKSKAVYEICYSYNSSSLKASSEIWWSEFLLYNINSKKSSNIKLTVSTSGKKSSQLTLNSCSNIDDFTARVNDFVQQFDNNPKNTIVTKTNNANISSSGTNISYANATISKPSLMVIPKKINPAKLINGEYQLSKYEKMLIAAFKNKFEDNHFITFGFESVLKRIYENRLLNDNVMDDIKSKILEGSGIDFFVEFENLDENNQNCDKVYEFKIRNFSTGEDVASDLKNLDQCGNSDVYKNFASSILNEGAVSKINNQFNSILKNGQKVNIVFTISNTSKVRFNNVYNNGIKLGVLINNCLQGLALKGNLELQEETDLRKQSIMYIPVIDETNGQRYQTTTCAEAIISYLKQNANIECDRVVSRQTINIKIK